MYLRSKISSIQSMKPIKTLLQFTELVLRMEVVPWMLFDLARQQVNEAFGSVNCLLFISYLKLII